MLTHSEWAIQIQKRIDEERERQMEEKESQMQEQEDNLRKQLQEREDELRKQEVSPEDPWKHRSKGMRCETCMWFVKKESKSHEFLTVGRCRRHAPTMNGYPVVFINDWCGDHKLSEEKL